MVDCRLALITDGQIHDIDIHATAQKYAPQISANTADANSKRCGKPANKIFIVSHNPLQSEAFGILQYSYRIPETAKLPAQLRQLLCCK